MTAGGHGSVPPPFRVDVTRAGDVVTLAVFGELDMATVEELRAVLPQMAEGESLVTDLRELMFMDSSGLRLLMQLDVRSRAEGWELVIARSPGLIQRALDLSRVSDRVRTVSDPAEARA